MVRQELKETVLRMRRQGMKYCEIREETSLSMDTIWKWLKEGGMVTERTVKESEGTLARVKKWLVKVLRTVGKSLGKVIK